MSQIKIEILTCCFFVKPPISANVISQVATIEQVHHEIEVLSVLEGVVHIHQEWTVELRENLALVHNTLHTPLR